MKKLTILSLIFLIAQLTHAQIERWETSHTASEHSGKWTRIAYCDITGAWQDYATLFEFLGNGSGNSTYYFGKLVARFKNQRAEAGPITHWDLVLFDSNIGAENIKAVSNGTHVDIYIRINNSYTKMFFTRIISGYSSLTPVNDDGFVSDLPPNDLVINCTEGSGQQYSERLGIGTTNIPEGYAFAVDGKAIMEEITVKLSNDWSDFVFEDDYRLRPLAEVETFIKENGHLPDIPSAAEVEADGVNLGAMDAKLLQKIEELTLYVIELEKKIDSLRSK